MAGFIALIFNPHAWAAIGLVFVLSFSGGVVKGWNASNADQWRQQAEALAKAAKQKEQIAEADRARAHSAAKELARTEAVLESVLHEAAKAPNVCRLSEPELAQLRRIASGKR